MNLYMHLSVAEGAFGTWALQRERGILRMKGEYHFTTARNPVKIYYAH